MSQVVLPRGVLEMGQRGADWGAWIDGLPRTLDDLLVDWQLSVDGEPWPREQAVAVPVRTPGGGPALLQVRLPAEAGEHEHLALQRWGGHGAVRLLRADPHRRAVLVERIHRDSLDEVWDLEACEVVAGLYRLLHVPAPPRLRRVVSQVEEHAAALSALPRSAPLPRRLVEQAIALARDFASDGDSTGTLVHGDLHYGKVVRSDRGPWLVTEPDPMSGDAHYEPAPMLRHRFAELTDPMGGQSVRQGIRRRFHLIVDVSGLDEDRARDWVVVRMMVDACVSLRPRPGGHHRHRPASPDAVTQCIAVAKAVQD